MRWTRILKRNIRDSFKSVFRNFSLSMAAIICTTITLILVSVSLILSYNVNNITAKLEKELTIVVYLNRETSEEQSSKVQTTIKKMDSVEAITFKSKEEWKAEMKKESETLETTLDYLETNPLLDSITVVVNDVKDLKSTTESIRKIENVSSAEYGEGMVENIVSIFDIISKATLVIVIALVLVTAFLISNTIKLTIFSRKTEIEIMRLVGTSNTVIKMPFVFEGFILGLFGAILPVILSIYGYVFLYDKFNGKLFSNIITLIEPFNFILFVSFILIIIGALVGMIGSYRAVRKYLKI